MHNVMKDWNDLKYVLSVLREGSTLAAARVLRTSQTTVMRRITALEEEFGLSLFERRRTGYFPTEVLTGLADSLIAVEAAHVAFERELALAGRGVSGTVRLTAPDLLVSYFMGDALAQFHRLYPSIRIELLTTDARLNLTEGEADVALRADDRPTEPTLFGRKVVADNSWSMCRARGRASVTDRPSSLAEIGGEAFIGPIDGIYDTPLTDWIRDNIPPQDIALRQNSLSSIYANVKAGLGMSVLPDIVTNNDADIEKLFPIDIEVGKEIWLLAPERHRKSAHVRILLDFLSNHLTASNKSSSGDAVGEQDAPA